MGHPSPRETSLHDVYVIEQVYPARAELTGVAAAKNAAAPNIADKRLRFDNIVFPKSFYSALREHVSFLLSLFLSGHAHAFTTSSRPCTLIVPGIVFGASPTGHTRLL